MALLLAARDLLNLWERALTQRPVQRALELLAIAHPELTPEQLQEFRIGRRDEDLLTIREALFGPRLDCLTTCPKCSERLEIAFDTGQLRATPNAADPMTTYAMVQGDCELEFRLPNSADMLWIADLSDVTLARRELFERCLQKAVRNGVPILATDLSDEIVRATAARMSEVDPQADIQIALTCPACSQQWSTAFDIASYLWIEINAWAMRLLREVHLLASAYGWRESEILALSPLRRQLYLDLIG
jgi:hypothetical protein